MNQLLQDHIETNTPTSADPESEATSQQREEGNTLSGLSRRELHKNGSTRVSRTPSLPPQPIAPRKPPRLWRIACVAGLLLIAAIWLFSPVSLRMPSRATLYSDLQTSEQDIAQLQTQYQEATRALQATRLELKKAQEDLRAANRELRLQQKARTEQAGPWIKLHERLSHTLQMLIESQTVTFSQHHERFILGLETAFLFEPGRYTLRAEGRQALDKITAVLRDFPAYGMRMAWHTHLDEIAYPELDHWAAAWQVAAFQGASTAFHLTAEGLTSERFSVMGSFLYRFSGSNGTENRSIKQPYVEIMLYPFES